MPLEKCIAHTIIENMLTRKAPRAGAEHEEREEHSRQVSRIVITRHTTRTTCGCVRGAQS